MTNCETIKQDIKNARAALQNQLTDKLRMVSEIQAEMKGLDLAFDIVERVESKELNLINHLG